MPAHNAVGDLEKAQSSGWDRAIDLSTGAITCDSVATISPVVSGYATGAGGAVTQGTGSSNFATGVTLHKPCGRITTATASGTQLLASGNEAEFTVTNSLVAATDVVLASIGTNFVNAVVSVYVKSTAAGSFVLGITNLSGNQIDGTTGTGAAIINFAIVKAVSA